MRKSTKVPSTKVTNESVTNCNQLISSYFPGAFSAGGQKWDNGTLSFFDETCKIADVGFLTHNLEY